MKRFISALLGLTCAMAAWSMDITVFGGDSSAPKMFLHEGKPRGILIDILKYADQELREDSFKVELYPWARSYRYASGGVGGIVGLSWTQERAALFDYSDPVYVDDVVIVVHKGREFSFKEMADLRGKRVGLGRGGSYGEAFEKAVEAGVFTVDGDGGAVERLNKLVLDRIDCALFNAGKAGFEEILRANKGLEPLRDALVVLPVPLRSDPNFLAFPKNMQMKTWLNDFNQIIKKGYGRGEIQKLIAQNLGS
ncbi:ABC transporter substrate-binding protein [Rhodoferax saidenbachensis]|uniref:ABC-type amino acid transport substrate-binding protein n=1 Tax=Rhodoferax saidenbachensis TaxID=1484693 RepID=A0ABU1ZJV6_9BURK|nr:ABC transporter substrate-binding protein [Rhodoferax saidenbachensis]MDR7305827.1 ABC-type amino acid transport substrate-binding protein [Rhodoferax saidenbachensis]